MKKYLPALVAGFGAGVLYVVPFTKPLTCCLIVPLAAVVSIVLEKKSQNLIGEFNLKRGIILGLFTGIFAAIFGSFFDILITFITKNNDIIATYAETANLIDSLPAPAEAKEEVLNLIKNIVDSIKETGFSGLYAISTIFNNLIVNSIFGMIGGLVGTKVLNSQNS